MALVNPIYVFLVPFLFLVTVPMALFAGVTTTLAFSVLICRGILVYLDLALTYVHRSVHDGLRVSRYLDQQAAKAARPGSSSSRSSNNSNSNSGSRATSPAPAAYLSSPPQRCRRRRRRSSASIVSGGSVTPVNDVGNLGLTPSIGPERDYEGLGGWRVGDDDIWTTINSRLELPDNRQYGRHHHRHHHRSPSGGGSTTPGEGGYLMMKRHARSPDLKATMPVGGPASPNCARTRAPSASTSKVGFGSSTFQDGYFSFMSPKAAPRKSASPRHAVL